MNKLLGFLFNRRKERWFPGIWVINGDRVIVGNQSFMCTLANRLWDTEGIENNRHFYLEIE